MGHPDDRTKEECYFIKFNNSTVSSKMESLFKFLNVVSSKHFDIISTHHVCFNGPLPVSILERLLHIDFVERNRMVKTMQIEQDAPWGLSRLSQPSLPLKNQFSFNATGKGVNVYVIDSGLINNHPELIGRVSLAFSAFGDTQLTSDSDSTGHGTHVSGIIAGTNVGVAKLAQVIALRVIDSEGSGDNSAVLAALEWISNNYRKPAVINMSVGGNKSTTIDNMVTAVVNLGIPIVVAAGNSDTDACNYSPSDSTSAFAVGSSSNQDQRSSFSNHGSCVFMHAPGEGIISSVPTFLSSNGYKYMSGTSMSSPFVAGVVALILESNPNITVPQIAAILKQYATPAIKSDSTGTTKLLLQNMFNGPSGELVTLAPPGSLPSNWIEINWSTTTIIVICCAAATIICLLTFGISKIARVVKNKTRNPVTSRKMLQATPDLEEGTFTMSTIDTSDVVPIKPPPVLIAAPPSPTNNDRSSFLTVMVESRERPSSILK